MCPKGGIWTLMDIISGPRWPEQPAYQASVPAERSVEVAAAHQKKQHPQIRATGPQGVTLQADEVGRFHAACCLGKVSFHALIDTGADICAIPEAVAKASGVSLRGLPTADIEVGGGTHIIKTKIARLDWLIEKQIFLTDVETHIFPSGAERSLIGLSVLNRLKLVRHGRVMTLAQA